MKKILITGAAGFIGSALADKILEQGGKVAAVDNLHGNYSREIRLNNIASSLSCHGYSFHVTDIRHYQEIMKVFTKEQPSAVVHIAGITGMKYSLAAPDDFYSNNVIGTMNVLEASRKICCEKFIFISTASVYGGILETVNESHPLPEPANPYVATKRLGEDAVRSYFQTYELHAAILRLFTVYGPRQRPEMAISRFVRQIDRGEIIEIYGDGSASRNYLYIENCVDAILKAIEVPYQFEIFNIGGKNQISLNGLIKLLEKHLAKKARIKYISAPTGVPDVFNASMEKAERLLGYKPHTSLEKGLKIFIGWYRKNKNIGG